MLSLTYIVLPWLLPHASTNACCTHLKKRACAYTLDLAGLSTRWSVHSSGQPFVSLIVPLSCPTPEPQPPAKADPTYLPVLWLLLANWHQQNAHAQKPHGMHSPSDPHHPQLSRPNLATPL